MSENIDLVAALDRIGELAVTKANLTPARTMQDVVSANFVDQEKAQIYGQILTMFYGERKLTFSEISDLESAMLTLTNSYMIVNREMKEQARGRALATIRDITRRKPR